MSDLHLSAQCMQHWCEVMQCLHTKLLKRLLKKTNNNNNKTYIHTYIMEMSPPLIITIKLELYNYGQNAYHSCLVLYWDCEYLTK